MSDLTRNEAKAILKKSIVGVKSQPAAYSTYFMIYSLEVDDEDLIDLMNALTFFKAVKMDTMSDSNMEAWAVMDSWKK